MAGTRVARRRELDISDLSGREKAAILLSVIGPDVAAQITAGLGNEELEAITLEIARLDTIRPELADAVIDEWEQTESAGRALAQGGVETARQILERSVGPQKASVMLKRIEQQLRDSVGFTTLRQADPQQVAGLLRQEHPQTIALICAHLEAPQTAALLQEFAAAIGSEVIYRLAKMEKVMPEVLQIVERSFGADAALSITGDMSASGGPATAAAALNLIPQSLEKELLEGVAQQDAVLCEQIKNLMFVFEDLARLDDGTLQRIMRDVDTKKLALALKAASQELKRRILATMTTRARSALEEEMEFLGPVKVRDVEAAQGEIVKTVRELEDQGEVSLGTNDEVLV